MPTEEHHAEALIETARLELDRAHRAALGMEAGEVRRGLELAWPRCASWPVCSRSRTMRWRAGLRRRWAIWTQGR